MVAIPEAAVFALGMPMRGGNSQNYKQIKPKTVCGKSLPSCLSRKSLVLQLDGFKFQYLRGSLQPML